MSEVQWPENVPIIQSGRSQKYRTPDGDKGRVTSILKVLGLGQEGIINWAAEIERSAAIMAATDVYAEGQHGEGPAEFAAAIEEKLGDSRKHVKELAKAGDIGTDAHLRVRWWLEKQLGIDKPEPVMTDQRSLWASMAFEDWWGKSGLKVIRCEQVVWDQDYAGTIDVIVECPRRGLGMLDLKTSKGVYESHHLQCAAYLQASRHWAPLGWAEIIRLPKKTDDPNFEVVPLGKMYGRTLTEEQLMAAFAHTVALWKLLVAKP